MLYYLYVTNQLYLGWWLKLAWRHKTFRTGLQTDQAPRRNDKDSTGIYEIRDWCVGFIEVVLVF
ncbi:hypothetical protein PN36_04895 [Candidatus Thiomargarita nelsonii]|uniref:Uncharacterized protein n=1 Tax=Candidatus Thiomargarita nelsonii TaxID=1003181 RepID=A0A4E0QW27_9GAMM|nr:hypothetical protein PN36_04895 [Candidatus Thiomargarita nelsonii]